MSQILVVSVLLLGLLAVGGQPAGTRRTFTTVINLETTSEDSANVSMGDLDGDGDLDLVLAKGRHNPLLDRVLLNDGKGNFVASNLGPTADRTYTAALADVDGDGDLDVLTSNDRPDKKLVYLNDGTGQFTVAGTEDRCHCRQSSWPELRVPQRRRRTVLEQLHHDSG
jgi:FG-GAP-like repeat